MYQCDGCNETISKDGIATVHGVDGAVVSGINDEETNDVTDDKSREENSTIDCSTIMDHKENISICQVGSEEDMSLI